MERCTYVWVITVGNVSYIFCAAHSVSGPRTVMHNLLAVVSGIVAVLGGLPYIRDILRHKTKPNTVTWFTWSLLNIITAIAALSGHAYQTAIFAFATGGCTTLITLLSLKDGIKKYTIFDIVCQVLAIVGIIAWRLTDRPALAVVLTIVASSLASLPTIRHAWIAPKEETWQFFAIDGLSGLLASLSVQSFSFLAVAFPLYIVLDDALIGLIILSRRNSM